MPYHGSFHNPNDWVSRSSVARYNEQTSPGGHYFGVRPHPISAWNGISPLYQRTAVSANDVDASKTSGVAGTGYHSGSFAYGSSRRAQRYGSSTGMSSEYSRDFSSIMSSRASSYHLFTPVGQLVEWTSWFSEEDGGYSEALSDFIVGIGCDSGRCDNKRLVVVKSGTSPVGGNEAWTDWFSEEDGGHVGCDGSRVVSQIRCEGDNCDNMQLRCSNLRNGFRTTYNDFEYVDYFSEEEGERICPSGYYLNGIRCRGSDCDDISLRCIRVEYSTSSHPVMDEATTATKYRPVYHFDQLFLDYCTPDWPTSANDETCKSSWQSDTPVYYQFSTCENYNVITYWLWYGEQKPCTLADPGHGNDWERISLYLVGDSALSKVKYYQHKGWYTRRRGLFESDGSRPKAWIGKIAHGSYHNWCDGHGASWEADYCPGGCGYWNDFRNHNSNSVKSDTVAYDLLPGQTINGITRPDREICTDDCEGRDARLVGTSGCWQNHV